MMTLMGEVENSEAKAEQVIIPCLNDKAETIDQSIAAAETHFNHTTQLLFSSKLSSHPPEAGLNPLVDSAAYLFFLVGKLKRIKQYDDLAKLHDKLLTEIKNFQSAVEVSCYNDNCTAEYVPTATYALCITIDDVVSETAWGGEGRWDKYSMVSEFFDEPPSQENFFLIVERFIIDPAIYIDVLEFLYICLTLGFRCRSYTDASEINYTQHEQITNSLYRIIQACRGSATKVLSPFPIKPKKARVPRRSGLKSIAMWQVAILVGAIFLVGFAVATQFMLPNVISLR